MNVRAVKNLKNLEPGTQVLFVILHCVGTDGRAALKKTDISESLKFSPQTIGRHLKTFVDCNILKYKYSGAIFLNPAFYYTGQDEDLERTEELYKKFKSDM